MLQKIGMHFDDASNGIFLSRTRHLGYHAPYSDAIQAALTRMDTSLPVEVLERQVCALQQRARYVLDKGLEPLYKSSSEVWEWWLSP